MSATRKRKGSSAMRIRLNCLACGHSMDLGDAYEDYAGEVKCWGCQAVLEVTLQEGKLKAMKRGGAVGAFPSSAERVELPGTLSPATEAELSAASHETR